MKPANHSSDRDDPIAIIQESSRQLARHMGHPRSYEHLAKMAESHLDKVSEIVCANLVDEDDVEIRMSDLAQRLGVELSSVSRKVSKLEEAGLVTRTTIPGDARAWRLQLTDLGRAELQKLQEVRELIVRDALASWSAADRKTFAQLFARFTDDLIANTRPETKSGALS